MLGLAKRTVSHFEVIDKTVDIGEAQDGLLFQFKWERLPDKRDCAWKPIKELYTDISDIVTTYLFSFKNKKIVGKVKLQLGI